ncbi:MAG: hypothetical protein JST07_11225 [Bacteroidetes bacterium]|nr:hypothetical protein [Bacteroidota bacterium]
MDLKILKKYYLESENKITVDRETYFKLSENTKDKLSRDVSFRPSGEVLISKIIRLYPPYLEIIKKEKPDKIVKIQKNNYEVDGINILDFI